MMMVNGVEPVDNGAVKMGKGRSEDVVDGPSVEQPFSGRRDESRVDLSRVPRWGSIPCWIVLVVGLPLGRGAWGAGFPGPAAPAAKVYRITGIAVNGRDGTPISRARITVTEVERGVQVRSDGEGGGPEGGGPRGGPGGGLGGDRFAAGGVGGRQGGGPQRRVPGASNGSQDPEPVTTDARGRFSVEVPHQGKFRVAGSARGFRQQAYEQQDGGFFAGVVLTPAAPEMNNLTLKLTADGTISGIVFDEAGEAVRNAQVRVEEVRPVEPNAGGGRRVNQSAQTDDRGRYEISPLAPGKYRVLVNARPWYATGLLGGNRFGVVAAARADSSTATVASPDPSLDVVYAETWFPAATDAASAETIVLSGGEERQADFHLTPMPSIHLRIPRPQEPGGEGAEGRRGAPVVTRTGPGGGFGYGATTVTTMASGEWDIGGLSPGTYSVRMGVGVAGVAPGMTQVTLGGGQTVVGLGAATMSVPVTMAVEGVPDRIVRQITLLDAATRQVYQSTRRSDGGEDEEGDPVARVVQVPAGRYEVYLGGTPGLFLTGLTATGAEVQGRTVTVSAAMKLTVHAATGLAQVEGVARRDGKAMVGGLVLLVPAGYGRADNIAPVREDETNTDGSFAVRGVIPGEYIVVAIDKGWGVNWRDATTLMGYLGKGVAVDLKGDGVVRKEVEGVGP